MARISLEPRNFPAVEQASVPKAPVSYLLMPHRTHFHVTPDKLSAPFISSNNSRKVLRFCWHGTELVRMLQKLLVRNSLHWPYWHSWVQAAKSLCRKFSPPALLSLYSLFSFRNLLSTPCKQQLHPLKLSQTAQVSLMDKTCCAPSGSSCWKPSLSQFSPRTNQFLALNKESFEESPLSSK